VPGTKLLSLSFDQSTTTLRVPGSSTMKLVLAAFSALALSAEARPRNAHVNRELLMSRAIKVTDQMNVSQRDLSSSSSNFQISPSHSIQFSSCVAIKSEPYDNDIFYSDTNIEYAKNGQIVSEKSYIVFNVCTTAICKYDGHENLYMISLDNYLTAVMGYYPTKTSRYCATCLTSQEYCA
jgi:hypothetical protein